MLLMDEVKVALPQAGKLTRPARNMYGPGVVDRRGKFTINHVFRIAQWISASEMVDEVLVQVNCEVMGCGPIQLALFHFVVCRIQ